MKRRLALVLGAGAVAACIIVEPPAELPQTPLQRPIIQRQLVVPPPSQVLTRWPDATNPLYIPVEADPGSGRRLQAAAFVDYDPVTKANYNQYANLTLETSDGGVAAISIGLNAEALEACHTLEVVIAYNFGGDYHVPAAPGGDSISWVYSPLGDLATCRVYAAPDAGLDAADGAADGAAGAAPGAASTVGPPSTVSPPSTVGSDAATVDGAGGG